MVASATASAQGRRSIGRQTALINGVRPRSHAQPQLHENGYRRAVSDSRSLAACGHARMHNRLHLTPAIAEPSSGRAA
jgi:hypothetical protein